jgi:protein MAK11
MKLVAGSYERFLWGWEVKEKKKQLEWAFSYPAHLGAIKCIASCGSVVATGGADDTIKVFDLNAQKDMGSLYKHEGAVTCLQFHGPRGAGGAPVSNHPTHLLSGSEDGSIFIWDTDSWIHLKTMRSKKDSKGAVNDLSIHPTGMMALSVDRDRHLKMWNLMSGRCSFTLKLRSEASIVKFAPQDGGSYSMVRDAVVEVRDAESGTVLHPLEHEKRVLCLAQQLDHLLITGGEDSVVRAWDTRTGKQAWSIANAHTNRIRGLAIVGSNLGSDEHSSGLYDLISSASSDGMVRVWDSRMVDTPTPAPIMEAETKARLTCLVSCGVSRSMSHCPCPSN